MTAHLDLVVGTFAGTFHLFKGQGKGKFPPEARRDQGGDGQPLKIDGYHSDPFVIDWDGDGDLDLLSGSSEGGVQWAENGAGPGKPPQLKAFRSLIDHGPPLEYGQILRDADLKGPAGNTRIWVDDINSDGKLDILVGDMAPLISPSGKVTEGTFKQKFAEWNKVARGCVPSDEYLGRHRSEKATGAAAALPDALRPAQRIHGRRQHGICLAVLAEVSPAVEQ